MRTFWRRTPPWTTSGLPPDFWKLRIARYGKILLIQNFRKVGRPMAISYTNRFITEDHLELERLEHDEMEEESCPDSDDETDVSHVFQRFLDHKMTHRKQKPLEC